MIAEPNLSRMSAQAYLDWEATQELRHDFVDGEVFAMTGGTIHHNLISLNLASLLKSHLRGQGCRVFMVDVKVQISENGPYHYPDVMVSCDPRDKDAIKLIRYPSLIVEVLSPSTEAYDRGTKFRHYRQLSTLQEYVLVEVEKIGVDRFSRLSSRKWELQTYTAAEEELELSSVGWQGTVDLLYEDIFESEQSQSLQN
jgi:Uma2 family endonuclease